MTDLPKKKKKYGQNFLVNQAIPVRIASESGIGEQTGVIEIGPGTGALTDCLAERAGKVVCIEIDDELIPLLSEKYAQTKNLRVVHADILEVDVPSLCAEEFADMPVCVCANLPYYITTPILMKLLECGYAFESITIMVQREVADRLCAKPGSSDYGAISVSVAYYGNAKKLFTVSPGSFSPPPKVSSSVVQIIPHQRGSGVPVKDKDLLFLIIKAAFGQRRKTLLNALTAGLGSLYSKNAIQKAIEDINKKPTVRGEELSVQEFAQLADLLS